MRYTSLVLMFLLAVAVVANATPAQERYVAALDVSDVSFIYNEDARTVTLIQTTETAEKVAEFVEKAPVGLTITVVTYQSKGKLGYELGLEEGADVE